MTLKIGNMFLIYYTMLYYIDKLIKRLVSFFMNTDLFLLLRVKMIEVVMTDTV